jgi:hypothetical protein
MEKMIDYAKEIGLYNGIKEWKNGKKTNHSKVLNSLFFGKISILLVDLVFQLFYMILGRNMRCYQANDKLDNLKTCSILQYFAKNFSMFLKIV